MDVSGLLWTSVGDGLWTSVDISGSGLWTIVDVSGMMEQWGERQLGQRWSKSNKPGLGGSPGLLRGRFDVIFISWAAGRPGWPGRLVSLCGPGHWRRR